MCDLPDNDFRSTAEIMTMVQIKLKTTAFNQYCCSCRVEFKMILTVLLDEVM
jgi:hypothetical protein